MKTIKKKHVVAALGVLLVIVGGVLVARNAVKRAATTERRADRIAQRNQPRPVVVEAVETTRVQSKRSFPGVVEAAEVSALSFRVGGPLVRVDVQPGTPVQKGDLLMRIDPRDFRDRIASLEAELAGAEAVLRRARRDHKRVMQLFQENVVSESDRDAAVGALESAEAAVQALQARRQEVRHALEDTSLHAPYDGVATRLFIENHEMVKAGTTVLEFANIQRLEVTVSVPENDMVRRSLDSRTPVPITFPAVPGESVQGRLSEWNAQANPRTRTYAVTFAFEAPDAFRVLPGMSANVCWTDGEGERERVTVPVSALCSGKNGESFVWSYDPETGKAMRHPVRTGALTGQSRVVVLKGLSEGDSVVVEGSRFVHEGMKLQPVASDGEKRQ